MNRSEGKHEIFNLRNMLDSNDESERKTAAKRVTALMRAGEDLHILFPSMLRCVKTADLELKKLAYHFITTYAQAEPEQSIMVVNTFVQDTQDFNPLVRALAVRTMCRIKLDTIAEHMILPLKKTLEDSDPYVRKTAALAVAKIYEVIPEQVENSNIFPLLLKLLQDENPMVVSNTTAALFEINEHRTTPLFTLNEKTVTPVLSALTQCSDWVQSILLDALAKYDPVDPTEANFLIERLIPYLKHANPSVVIGSFRCIFYYMDRSNRPASEIFPSIIPPFITLISTGEPEIQFIVLRTISLFVQKYPKALSKEIRVFFCKYNDPSYIKMEKLNIIVQIVVPKNVQLVIDELDEYCNSIDVGFVRKSIETLGQIAIKIEASARRCVDVLIRLVESKADYTVEESIIVVTDLLRRFPGEFESVIGTVCSHIDIIKDAKAKAAAIWILGEYCDRIEKVDLLLDPYLDTFQDETPEVQIQLLTALVKVYVAKPEETKDQLQFILTEAIKENVLPDVRNRALIYWRLLSADTEAARKTVVFEKRTVSKAESKYNEEILDELIKNMGNVSGVLHVIPSDFVRRVRFMPEEDDEDGGENGERQWTLVLNDPTVSVFVDWSTNTLHLKIVNKAQESLRGLKIAVNKNMAGINITENQLTEEIRYGESFEKSIKIVSGEKSMIGNPMQSELQFALGTNEGTKLFTAPLSIASIAQPIRGITPDDFARAWQSAPNEEHIAVDGTLADNGSLEQHGAGIVSSNVIVEVAFLIGESTILAKARQNEDRVEIIVRGHAELLPLIRAGASSMFCSQ